MSAKCVTECVFIHLLLLTPTNSNYIMTAMQKGKKEEKQYIASPFINVTFYILGIFFPFH